MKNCGEIIAEAAKHLNFGDVPSNKILNFWGVVNNLRKMSLFSYKDKQTRETENKGREQPLTPKCWEEMFLS